MRFNPDSPQLDMPPVNFAEHILYWLFEVGPAQTQGMGAGPISFLELSAWTKITGINPSAWEILTLRHLSTVFVTWSEKAKDKHCQAPWPPQEIDRDKVAKQIDKVFDRIERNQKRRKK